MSWYISVMLHEVRTMLSLKNRDNEPNSGGQSKFTSISLQHQSLTSPHETASKAKGTGRGRAVWVAGVARKMEFRVAGMGGHGAHTRRAQGRHVLGTDGHG